MSYAALVSKAHRLNDESGLPAIAVDRLGDVNVSDIRHWIIDTRDWELAEELIRAVRQNPAPHVYLKPVLLLTGRQGPPRELAEMVDYVMLKSEFQIRVPAEAGAEIEIAYEYIKRIPDADKASDKNLPIKVLRFLASRGQEIRALTTVGHRSGFVYSRLLPFFPLEDDSAIRVLEFLQSQHLIHGEFQNKAYFCYRCGCAFLNFVETCPDCSSADLHMDDLIHHFKCAYTGPERDYRKGGKLVCPKCSLGLRHIGVDYDKPSIIYACNQCGNDFQDPRIESECYHCGHTTEPENQVHRKINRYSITSIGENAAMYGLDTLFTRLLENDLQLYPYDVFKQFVGVEVARIRRYHISHSALLMVELEDLDQLYLRVGSRAKEVFGELSQLFKSHVRESDIISTYNESLFLLMLTETELDAAERVLKRLADGVQELLETNLEHHSKVAARAVSLDDGFAMDTLLEQFMKRADA